MDVRLKIDLTLVLSNAEVKVLTKALRGMLTEEDKPLALALQEKIMLDRVKAVRHLLTDYEKTEANIAAAHDQG